MGPIPGAGEPAALGTELTGDLRCARCRYNLRGLSVRSVCPECGTPVPVTLLAVLDPQAAELQPIPHPRFTAGGMTLWAVGALGAALVTWLVRLAEGFPAMGPLRWAPWTAAACLIASALGGLALVHPHAGIRLSSRLAALAASLGCLGIAWIAWSIMVELDGPLGRPYLAGAEWSERWAWKIGETLVIGLVVLGFRPVFHILQARSHLLRSGKVERQALRALAASAAVVLCGDLVQAAVRKLGISSEVPTIVAMCITGVGSLLLTAGLLGVVIDVKRLLPVILAPPLGLSDVLGRLPEGIASGAVLGGRTPAAESTR